jgi:predicted nuclease of predicted toxin-antitoxin system
MKFLADMGVSPVTVLELRQQGYNAVHLNEQGLERLPDSEILEKARQEQRIVLTFDLDFGELLAISSESLPSVIIFRLQTTIPVFVSARLLAVLSECSEDLETGAIVTVEDNRYRVRRLPI